MPEFHWTKEVWALAALQLAICELQYVLQYIVMNWFFSLQTTNFYDWIAYFSSLSTNTTSVTTAATMVAAGRNGPLAPYMRPCTPRQRVEWMADNPPSKRVYFFGLLRVCMALKALLCSSNDVLPQHRSVLRAIHTLNNPKNYIYLLGRL